jgi:polar amino acid transport system permease protein
MTKPRSAAQFCYRYLEPMTLVGVFLLAVSVPAVILLGHLEHRYARRDQRC